VINKQHSIAAIYLRLSRDDGGDAESNSIGNQRDMLRKYAKDNGFHIHDEYIDDGISGTTFERANFQRMIGDVENKKIGTIICKDLSRLGRNNALVAYYTEIFFPENGIRFICVNDGIDSDKGENEIMGFKSVINEYYARDISKKIRSSFRSMVSKGLFIGSMPPYGYALDPADRHHLIPNEETAQIVKEMFRMAAEGIKPHKITVYLSERKILTPRAYIACTTGQCQDNHNKEFPTEWGVTTVLSILKNRVYCGHIIGQKETTQSFKSKKTVQRPESEWIVCKNMHKELVDEQTFARVQSLIKTKKRENKSYAENIFAGLLKCPTCGYNLCYVSPKNRSKTGSYVCNLYKQHSRTKTCTSHYIRFDSLNDIVLAKFRKLTVFIEEHKSDLKIFYNRFLQDGLDSNSSSNLQMLKKYQNRIRELDTIIKKIVEQNSLGSLTDERFALLSREYETEHRDLSGKIEELQKQLNQKRDTMQNAESFLTAIGKYTQAAELTLPLLHDLIERIEVHECEGKGKERTQGVDVYWRFIGFIPDN